MAIRYPLTTALDVNNSTVVGSGPASTAGGIAYPFQLPQDTDGVVVKLQASILAGGVSATFQTSDDGGSTWFDVARSSIVSNSYGDLAEWINIPVNGFGYRSGFVVASTVATGSVIATTTSIMTTTGRSAASTLGQKEFSGLPIMGLQNRIFMRYTAAVTSVLSERIQVKVQHQSATA